MASTRKSRAVEIENHGMTLRKRRQSSATPLAAQRKVFNEIGNMLQQSKEGKAHLSEEQLKYILRPPRRASQVPQKKTSEATSCLNCRKSTKLVSVPVQRLNDAKRRNTHLVSYVDINAGHNIDAIMPPVGIKIPEFGGALTRRAPRLTMKPLPATPEKNATSSVAVNRQSVLASCKTSVKLSQICRNNAMFCGLKKIEVMPKAISESNDSKQRIPDIKTIDDIDAPYKKCLWMVASYAHDIFRYLLQLDAKISREKSFLQVPSVGGQMRAKLVDWLARIYFKLQLYQETFQLSVSIMDRYMLRDDCISSNVTQLMALCCMSLSIKYEEMMPVSIETLLSFTSQPYTKKEFLNMEVAIVQKLEFRIVQPVPIVFLRRFNIAAKCDKVQHSYGKYMTDLAQLDLCLAKRRASELAAASVFIAVCIAKNEVSSQHWNSVLHHYTAYSFKDIQPVVSKLASLVKSGCGKYCYVRMKYSADSCHRVSEEVDRKAHLLEILANPT